MSIVSNYRKICSTYDALVQEINKFFESNVRGDIIKIDLGSEFVSCYYMDSEGEEAEIHLKPRVIDKELTARS